MHPRTRVHPRSVKRIHLLAAAIFPVMGCAGSAHVPDMPVPASEPRETVRLRVELTRAQDCEEAFDLALYRSKAVELVAWDAAAGRCADRTITIRYLSRQTSRDEVIRAASAAAAKVSVETNGEQR